jgi:anaerobic selenocysteine-containing dehydrogenase
MFAHPPHLRTGKGTGRGFTTGRWASRATGSPEVRSEFPVAQLPAEVLTPGDGQIRALITVAGNPALSSPDSAAMNRALGSLEFMVSVDPWRNETTRYADVILPPPGPLARSQYDLPFTRMAVRNLGRWSPPIFEHDGPAEWEILAKLALIASGLGPDADPSIVGELMLSGAIQKAADSSGLPADSVAELVAKGDRPYPDRVVDVMIRTGTYGDQFGTTAAGFGSVEPLSVDVLAEHPHGIDLGPLRPELPAALATVSGKVELFPEAIVADLARLRAWIAEPRPELVLIGRRHLRSNNSWMHNTRVLVKGKNRCVLQVNPVDAERLGLHPERPVRVSSAAGSIEAPIEITDRVMVGVVSLPHGWGHGEVGTDLTVANEHTGVNSNVLTDGGTLDPLSGNARLNGIPVTLAPA